MLAAHLIYAFPLVSYICYAAPLESRAEYKDKTIYVYGTDIPAYPVTVGPDGNPYITKANTSSDYPLLKWDITSDGSAPWNATLSNGTEVGRFGIAKGSSSFDPPAFVPGNGSAPSGIVTAGFGLFGGQVVFINGSQYQSNFWAEKTNTEGMWMLRWNANGVKRSNSEPVVLKITAPSPETV